MKKPNPPAWVKSLVQLLDEAVRLDAPAIRSLITHRVPCNNALADHSTIQVGEGEGPVSHFVVGMLGVLNGYTQKRGWRVEAVFSAGGRLTGFQTWRGKTLRNGPGPWRPVRRAQRKKKKEKR